METYIRKKCLCGTTHKHKLDNLNNQLLLVGRKDTNIHKHRTSLNTIGASTDKKASFKMPNCPDLTEFGLSWCTPFQPRVGTQGPRKSSAGQSQSDQNPFSAMQMQSETVSAGIIYSLLNTWSSHHAFKNLGDNTEPVGALIVHGASQCKVCF